ncbi:MAG TPA: DUF2865 domain-containing protein [Roseiarcus sp.]|nr:DUF2865 domain-containing protein [Roseiarcus sp.]
MTNERGGGALRARRRRARTAWAAAALLAMAAGDAGAQDAQYCQQLRAQIAAAGQVKSGPAAAYDAAAQKQKAEIDKTIAYSRQIGCENRKFLFFGKDPPAQCGALYAQIARMQANLGQLQARGSGGGGGEARAQLVARYQSECEQTRPRGFFEALFGNPREEPLQRVTDVPLVPDPNAPGQPGDNPNPTEGVQAHAGSKEVCVRTCDGYFFPIGYSGSGGRSGDLQEMCRALCPNAEVALYSYSPAGDITEAVGADGTRYADLPNALKYRKSLDPSCTCRRRGQSWAQALAEAEALLGERKTDIIVTQEKSDEMSRARPDPKAKPGKNTAEASKAAAPPPPSPAAAAQDANDALIGEQSATVSRENSGIASGDAASGPSFSKTQGQTEEVTGPDGVKRRVRIIDPAL